MNPQEETLKVVVPLVTYMEHSQGWVCKKLHGSQFQEGMPDLFCYHYQYEPRFIECKVIRNGDLHFTDAQMQNFPVMLARNVKIWLIAAHDLRKMDELKRAYNVLFGPPNLGPYLDPKTRRMLLR